MFDLPPPDPSLEISVASRGYSKGIAQTDGAQAIVRGEIGIGPFYAAAQWKNVDSQGADGEASTSFGVRGHAGGFELNAGLTYKRLNGRGVPSDLDTFELSASASRHFGPVTPRISIVYSFDDLGAVRQSIFVEGGAALRLGARTSMSVAIGRRERSGGDDYTAFSAGISRQIGGPASLELRYYDTAQSARGDVYRGRLVAALRLRF